MIKFTTYEKKMLLAQAEVSLKWSVNGEKSLTGVIYTNEEVLNNVDRGWSLEFNGEKYYITYAKPSDKGNKITVEFDAVHEYFFLMGKSSVYTQLSDGSHTAQTYLDLIFKDSGYTYVLATPVEAFEKQSFGMDTRLSLFNNFINQTGLEFSISSKTVTISEKIGSDLSTIVRKGFNLQELGLEYNIGDFVTYCKGFGAYLDENDQSKGRIEAEYTSPLAKIYGKLEAAPFSDERYTVKDNLLTKITELVDSSYSISVNLTVEDLQKAGYEYSLPNPGDYILAVDEALGFSQKIRIVSVEIAYDINGNRLQSQVTCGSLSAVDQKNQADAQSGSVIDDLINGNSTIPVDWLNDAIVIATNALMNTQTQLEYTSNGILAIDKTNANNVVIFNAAGIGVSTDGGKTFANAMTGAGINATAITAGVLRAISIIGVTISGSSILSQSSDNSSNILLHGGQMSFTNADGNNVGLIFPSYDGSTKKANGLAIEQIPGFIFSINSKSKTASTSKAVIQIPADSHQDEAYVKFPEYIGGGFRNKDNDFWIMAKTRVILSGNNGNSNALNVYGSKVDVLGDFTVYNGSKNAAHVTRNGVRLTPAYETAESYLGDIGSSKTDDNGQVTIEIETLFSDAVNTDYEYQVFLQSYGDGYVYVSERTATNFTVQSSSPNLSFGWEIKARRRGYEKTRLELSDMTFEELKKAEESMGGIKNDQQNI